MTDIKLHSSSKSIGIYTSSGFPSGGSDEHFVSMMCEGIVHHGTKVDLFLVRGNKNKGIRLSPPGVKVRSLLFSQRVDDDLINIIETILLFFIMPLSPFVFKTFKNKNIIILYGLEYPYYTLPILILKLLGVKVYRIITDDYPKKIIAPNRYKIVKWWMYKFQRKIVDRFFNGLICLTTQLAQNAINAGVFRSRVCVIPHFIDVERPKKAKDLLENTAIGYAGTFSENNGYIDLLISFKTIKKEYPHLKLYLIGTVNEEIVKYINNQFPIDHADIIMSGYLSKNGVQEKLSQCRVLVNPRRKSKESDAGFPTKLGEYFSARVPVVSTLTGDIGNYFSDGKEIILVEPNNPEQLAYGIRRLLEDANLSESVANCGYEWARKNIDYRVSASKLLNFVYRSVV